jgi:hypothetical protein
MRLPVRFIVASAFVVCVVAGQSATLPNPSVAGPTAVAKITEAGVCFARIRKVEVERLPPSYLMLQLKLRVSYRNPGTRPLIMPLGHERTIYTALKPGVMNVFHDLPGFVDFAPAITTKMLKDLPPEVSPDNPVNPKNDVFAVIPANGEIALPELEEITMPVNHKTLFRHDPDLRGHRLYLRLQLAQQGLDPALETDLSDRWTRFGVPWTGSLLTNVVTIDVPQQFPQAKPCIEGAFSHPGNRPADIGK